MSHYTDDELLDLLAYAVLVAYYDDQLTYAEKAALDQFLEFIEERYEE